MFEGIKDWFSENVVRRKVFFFGGLLAIWLLLLGGAYFSPQRQIYTNEQLTTKQSFVNGTGDIAITSQVYSPSTGDHCLAAGDDGCNVKPWPWD